LLTKYCKIRSNYKFVSKITMNIKKKAFASGIGVSLLPLLALAQSADTSYFDGLLDDIGSFIGSLVPVLIGVAVVVFIWGVIKYTTAGDDPEKRAAARSLMIYGIIAIFVIVSIWGLVAILQQLTGTGVDNTVIVPDVGF
jgi:uncharacterized membrane protein YidH (DUF202 family)